MRLYNQAHAFYAGVDLHARSMFTHVLDQRGRTVFERDLPACPGSFLEKRPCPGSDTRLAQASASGVFLLKKRGS